MALKRLPYTGIGALLQACPPTSEDRTTRGLMERLRSAWRRGYLTPGEFEAVCRWKSARALQHIRANSPWQIRSATAQALSTRSERRKLEALRTLRGVSVPMASAILTLLDPRRYGVIDIRVWQLLYALDAVAQKPNGVGFTFNNWYRFLMIVRYFARKLAVDARDVERTLFAIHRRYQKGRLYGLVERRPPNKPLHRTGARVARPAGERRRYPGGQSILTKARKRPKQRDNLASVRGPSQRP